MRTLPRAWLWHACGRQRRADSDPADIYSNTATSGGGLTLDTATGIVLTSTVRGNLASAGTSGGINVTGASAACVDDDRFRGL